MDQSIKKSSPSNPKQAKPGVHLRHCARLIPHVTARISAWATAFFKTRLQPALSLEGEESP
jgi:hypothetical protein